jgi:hypothetical protein
MPFDFSPLRGLALRVTGGKTVISDPVEPVVHRLNSSFHRKNFCGCGKSGIIPMKQKPDPNPE